MELQLFSWDEAKNRTNQRKHGISFETAKRVFEDPFHLTRQDRIENGEVRWQTIGVVSGMLMLLLVHAEYEKSGAEEHIRIISARRVTKQERKIYEQDT